MGICSEKIRYHFHCYWYLMQFVSDLDEILDIKCTNKYIVTATNSEQIKLFDHKEGSCVVLTGHSDTVMSLDVSVDGGMLVSGSKVCLMNQ